MPINDTYQPDAFTDQELVNKTPTPTANTDGLFCDQLRLWQHCCWDCANGVQGRPERSRRSGSVDASDFTVNDIRPDSCMLNGNSTIRFHFNTTPVMQGPNTMHIPAGGFDCACGPVPEFTCTFTYKPSTPTPTPTATLPQVQLQHLQLRLL